MNKKANQQISLNTDDYLIPKKIHNQIKNVFISAGYEIKESRRDTHAMGGPFWFPTDLVLTIGELIIAGFIGQIGAKGLDSLVNAVKRINSHKKDQNFRVHYYISTNISKNLNLYFDFDLYDYKNDELIMDKEKITVAFMKMPETINKIKHTLNPQILHYLGEPESIILKYDFEISDWIIYQYNSDLSIFYDEMAHKEDLPFWAKLLSKIMDIFHRK